VDTDAQDAGEEAERSAEQVGDSRPVRGLARGGLVAYGLVHLLISWIAVRIAWGTADQGSADSSGAMKALAAQPFGAVLLWAVAIGMFALSLWQACELIWGAHATGTGQRVQRKMTSGSRAVVYAVWGASAISVALGSRPSSSQSQQHATSGVLAWPGGQQIVVAVGVIVFGVGAGMIVKGVRVKIGDEIDLDAMSARMRQVAERLGQVGYATTGVAFGIVGGLLTYAALTFDQRQSQGLDGAMQTVLAQPFGRFLLTAVALGFTAFGLYAMLQSKFRRM
jgi:hypothetical protein